MTVLPWMLGHLTLLSSSATEQSVRHQGPRWPLGLTSALDTSVYQVCSDLRAWLLLYKLALI